MYYDGIIGMSMIFTDLYELHVDVICRVRANSKRCRPHFARSLVREHVCPFREAQHT